MKIPSRLRVLISSLAALLILNLHAFAVLGQSGEEPPPSNGSRHYLNQAVQQESNSTNPQSGSQSEDKKERRERRAARREQNNGRSEQSPDSNGNSVTISSDDQRKDGDVFIATGYVVIVNGESKLQADKVIYNSTTGEANAEGNVVYDPDEKQRITADRAEINVLTRKGVFYNATGFTDQTSDGAQLNFVAERAEKTNADTYVLYGVSVTACEQAIPIWSFESDKATVRVGHTAAVRGGVFRFKNVPIFYMPVVKLPIGREDRKSGFLIPTTGSSTTKGRFFQQSYFQTLGRSADLLLRSDLYTKRGFGLGASFRVRTDEQSYLRIGAFGVADRVLGDDTEGGGRDEGGTLFFAKGVQYLPHGFLAAVDVDFTTSINFRRTFARDAEQIFNPENRSQFYVTNNFTTSQGSYSFNMLAEKKTDKLFNTLASIEEIDDPNINIEVRHLPSFSLSGYGQQVGSLPLYLSFDTAAEGVFRRDRLRDGGEFLTPEVVQRFDMSPKLLLAVPDLAGWIIRPEFRLRSTYYTNSLRPPDLNSGVPLNARGDLSGKNIFRRYTEFAVDVRPPALSRVFKYDDTTPRFKHVVEPYFTYRNISGIDDFNRIIRFDSRDAVADTNEFEYGVINRFFEPRYANDGSTSTHEFLSVSIAQKYFFDTDFGGAFRSGARNQFFPIDTLSGFTFGGRERRFSPLNFNIRYRPLSAFSADMRFDYDTVTNKVRNFSVTGSITQRLFSISQRFYRSATQQIAPGFIEPGTFPGSLLVSNISLGNERRGFYGGANITYDFTNRRDVLTGLRTSSGLRRSSSYFGYACECGSVEINFSTFNVGGFRESRFSFSFILSGIGSFGTDRLQQY